jgi:hypothetical protein
MLRAGRNNENQIPLSTGIAWMREPGQKGILSAGTVSD